MAGGDDRLLTDAEYEKFKKDYARLSLIQDYKELQAFALEQQTTISELQMKLLDQAVYIKVLEQLEASRRDKLAQLEATLAQLETEVMRLK